MKVQFLGDVVIIDDIQIVKKMGELEVLKSPKKIETLWELIIA